MPTPKKHDPTPVGRKCGNEGTGLRPRLVAVGGKKPGPS